MKFGIDLGNDFTKTSKLISFPSRIKNGHQEMNKDEIKVEYKGKKYTVGTGTPVLGNNRIYSEMYDICLLTAIAKSSKDDVIEAEIVVGLPPELYDSELKDNLKEKLLKFGQQEFIIWEDNTPIKKFIKINRAEVFAESSIIFQDPKKFRDQKTVIIDIGGGTTDISQFNGLNRVDYTTTDLGMLELFKNMKKKINSTYTAKFEEEDMPSLVNKSETIIRGDVKDISFIKDIIKDHVTQICNKANGFDIDSSELILIGGGAIPLYPYFKSVYNNITVFDNSQYANALTYESVGVMLWNV